jgi:predicted PurR-regulated permease PerM
MTMTEQNDSQRGPRILIIMAAFVVVIWGIYQAQAVLVPFLVAVFLAVIVTSPLLWLERKRIPSVIAVLLVVGGIIGILLIIGALVGTSINSFLNALPFYEARIQEKFIVLKDLLTIKEIESPDKLVLKYVNPGAVMSLTASLLSGLGLVLSNIVLILLTVMFILLEASSFPVKLRAVLGVPQKTFPQFSRFVDTMKRYLVIQTAISLIAGILIGIWLAILVWISPFSGVSWPFCLTMYPILVLLSLRFPQSSWLLFNWEWAGPCLWEQGILSYFSSSATLSSRGLWGVASDCRPWLSFSH